MLHLCVSLHYYGAPERTWRKNDGEKTRFCEILQFLFFFLKKCASGSVPGSKIHTKMVYMHYPCELIEFYFRMGLTYKDNKSVQIFKYAFKYLESVKDQNTFYRFVSWV